MTVSETDQSYPSPSGTESPTPDPKRDSAYPLEFVLLGYFALVVVLLGITAFIARMYHKDVHVLADNWFAKGEAKFKSGDAAQAVIDYRNALVYSPGNAVFQLHLAQALSAVPGRRDEARSYLLNLLTESPGSGEINLDLARIEKDSMRDALRYYNGAIYGVWEKDPAVMRWNVRRELCEYLLTRGTMDQAQPEIIALAQEVPPGDVAREKDAAALLLRVKLWSRAFDEYRAVLARNKHDEDALAGAGIAAFQMSEYARAIPYFNQLPPQRRAAADVSSFLSTARDIDAENPFVRELPSEQRVRRALAALAQAESRLQQCLRQTGGSSNSAQPPAQSSAQAAAQLQKLYAAIQEATDKWNQKTLARDPSEVDALMQLVFQAENAAAQQCGEPQDAADRALLLIAQSQTGAEP